MDKVGTSQLRHNVPGTLPLDRREKISRYLESSVGHGGQDAVSEARAEEDRDSGDSLFLTQVDVTLPVAEGSAGQRHTTSNPTFSRDLTEREDIFSSSSSDDEQRRRRKKDSLPTYNFPFLKTQKRRHRRTDQYKDLHNYMIGGFFKCLQELRQCCQREQTLESSLPTVDMDGDISPLSEEDREKSEDEDIKVVEKKYFVSLSTKKSKQNWCNELKKQDGGKGTNTGKNPQTEMSSNKQIKTSMLKDIQMSLDSESFDNGTSSSCNVLDQKGRKAKHATGDGNFLATTDREKNKNVSLHQKASEEGQKMCNANDAGLLKSLKSLGQAAQKGREAPEPVNRHEGDGPESQHLLHGHPDRTGATTVKKAKKSGPHAATSVTMEAVETPVLSGGCKAAQTSEVPEMNGKNGMEDLSRDGDTLRQEEGDIPDSKPKEKKKMKSSAERVGQGVDGKVESEVRVETGAKKKRRKERGKSVEHLRPSAVAEPPNDGADIQKEKKKDLGIVMTEEHEAEGALNRTLDVPAISTEQLGESGNCLENVATSQETSRLSFVKRKKDKKKQQSFCNDAPDQRKEGADRCRNLDDSVTTATGSRTTPKKKRTIFEETNDSFYTKKKKKSEIVSGDKCEDTLAQRDDSASTRKRGKKKSSFLVADVEETNVPTHREPVALSAPRVGGHEELEGRASDQEELNNGVADQKKKKKKKKKRKVSVVQDSVEKDHEENQQEPGKARQKSENEELDCAADAGFPLLDEASGLKKKKKKKKRCHDVIEEDPPTAKDGRTDDEVTTEALTSAERNSASSETPGHKVLETRKKKKKKIKNDRGESTELERRENKEKQRRDEKSTVTETSDIRKNMHGKLKRKLYNPNEEFLTGSSFKDAD
ncbi:transcriptional regulator ATRX-like [Pungitius pungitius]|uniref:transcriptional regulator ATRX-like n=1 Tax=Pungitius pungitius TaxID=134920 RepID=UPI002E109ADD